jgi:DNA polymerase III subunit alpha
VVATNDTHFLKADDHQAHDVLLCIGLGKDFNDPNRMKYDGGSTSRTTRRCGSASPAARTCWRTPLRIAEECNWSYPKGYHVPAFPFAEAGFETEAEMLRDWVWRGMLERYAPDAPAGADRRPCCRRTWWSAPSTSSRSSATRTSTTRATS